MNDLTVRGNEAVPVWGAQQASGHAHEHHHHAHHGHPTLEDVLGLGYPHALSHAPKDGALAWLHTNGDLCDLWRCPANGLPQQLTEGRRVRSFSWSQADQLAWIDDGYLFVDGADIALGEGDLTHLAWSREAGWLAAIGGGRHVHFWSTEFGSSSIDIGDLVGSINAGPVSPLAWSPDGKRLAVATRSGGRRGLSIVNVDEGSVAWSYKQDGFVTDFVWLDADRLHVTIDFPPERRSHGLVSIENGNFETLVDESGPAVYAASGAHACPVPVLASADGRMLVYTLHTDGWAHLYAMDVATRALRQLTSGAWDDAAGDRYHAPCWADGGTALIYPSSRGDHKQRHLWKYNFADDSVSQITIFEGTDHAPVFSERTGQLAFIHSGAAESPDIWVLDAGSRVPRQLTRSMPSVWTDETAFAPMHVTFPSSDGASIHADLYLPAAFDPSQKYPVLVFVHGGTIDQMRMGWGPGEAYLGIHGWHQYLLHHGFAVLSVDYRGTSGYGIDYQSALWGRMGKVDVDDCVAAANWLQTQPWVTHDRIGIWGISYGGYLTLAALTKAPGTFAAGICVAGVWDWDLVREQRAGADVCLSRTGFYRMTAGCETPQDIEEARREASPKNFVDQMTGNLLVLHGTGDRKVTSDQMDSLVADCVKAGKRIEVMYYPGESHVFRKRETWRDAYIRMQDFLERRLSGQKLSCC